MKGPVTWRCKECHGWDYRGEDGLYGSGPHYTGIKGIRRLVGVDPERIEKTIRDETHAYTPEMLPDGAVRKLALFVSQGQINMDQYIGRGTKEVLGNLDRGALFYQTVCVICHGFDGARITFDAESTALAAHEDPKYMGTMANKNPWEVLHKIRNGQPGVGMVSLRMLSIQDQVDVLAYIQTLPLKKVRRRRY
jgi:thiosulfate dehydrogenase